MSSDLQETYLNCIQSEDKLWDNFSPFYEGATKDPVIKVLVENVNKTIRDQKAKAVQKYYSLQLIKLCLSTKSKPLANSVAKNLLPIFIELSNHNIGSKDPKRGENIFGPGQDKTSSNDFYFLMLESIKAWSLLFPESTDFKKAVTSLTKKGVIFPTEMTNYQEELKDLQNVQQQGETPTPYYATPQAAAAPPQTQQMEDPQQTNESVIKLTKFLTQIDANLKNLNSAVDDSQVPIESFSQYMEPLKKQSGKISEALIEQVLALPQNMETEALQKKLFEVKELLENILSDYQIIIEKPKNFATKLASIKRRVVTYLQQQLKNIGVIQVQRQQAQKQAPQDEFQPKKKVGFGDFQVNPSSQNNKNFQDFAFKDFEVQQPIAEAVSQDVFTEFGAFPQAAQAGPTQKKKNQEKVNKNVQQEWNANDQWGNNQQQQQPEFSDFNNWGNPEQNQQHNEWDAAPEFQSNANKKQDNPFERSQRSINSDKNNSQFPQDQANQQQQFDEWGQQIPNQQNFGDQNFGFGDENQFNNTGQEAGAREGNQFDSFKLKRIEVNPFSSNQNPFDENQPEGEMNHQQYPQQNDWENQGVDGQFGERAQNMNPNANPFDENNFRDQPEQNAQPFQNQNEDERYGTRMNESKKDLNASNSQYQGNTYGDNQGYEGQNWQGQEWNQEQSQQNTQQRGENNSVRMSQKRKPSGQDNNGVYAMNESQQYNVYGADPDQIYRGPGGRYSSWKREQNNYQPENQFQDQENNQKMLRTQINPGYTYDPNADYDAGVPSDKQSQRFDPQNNQQEVDPHSQDQSQHLKEMQQSQQPPYQANNAQQGQQDFGFEDFGQNNQNFSQHQTQFDPSNQQEYDPNSFQQQFDPNAFQQQYPNEQKTDNKSNQSFGDGSKPFDDQRNISVSKDNKSRGDASFNQENKANTTNPPPNAGFQNGWNDEFNFFDGQDGNNFNKPTFNQENNQTGDQKDSFFDQAWDHQGENKSQKADQVERKDLSATQDEPKQQDQQFWPPEDASHFSQKTWFKDVSQPQAVHDDFFNSPTAPPQSKDHQDEFGVMNQQKPPIPEHIQPQNDFNQDFNFQTPAETNGKPVTQDSYHPAQFEDTWGMPNTNQHDQYGDQNQQWKPPSQPQSVKNYDFFDQTPETTTYPQGNQQEPYKDQTGQNEYWQQPFPIQQDKNGQGKQQQGQSMNDRQSQWQSPQQQQNQANLSPFSREPAEPAQKRAEIASKTKLYQEYQLYGRVVRDSEIQCQNQYDQIEVAKTYKILEVSPEIRRRNQEFQENLNKEEAIKNFLDDTMKELLALKASQRSLQQQSSINQKLEVLTQFKLVIVEKHDLPKEQKKFSLIDQVQDQFGKEKASKESEQRNANFIKEIKDLRDKINDLQEQVKVKAEKDIYNSQTLESSKQESYMYKNQYEEILKEYNNMQKENEKILEQEKSTRTENDKLIQEVKTLREELVKEREDQAQVMNEVLDPQYFSKNSMTAGANGEYTESEDRDHRKAVEQIKSQYEEFQSVQTSKSMRDGYKDVINQANLSQQEITNRVKNNLNRLLELNYSSMPHSSHNDGLVRMLGAKTIQQQKKEKNKLFFQSSLFKELNELQIYNNDRKNLENFKYSCISNKAILFENAFLQIGAVSDYTSTATPSSLKISLHFINKRADPFFIGFSFTTSSKFVKTIENVSEGIQIKGKSQKKFKLEASLFDIDQPLIFANITLSNSPSASEGESTKFAMPISINKFFVWIPIDQIQFKNRWSMLNTIYVHNEPREFNQRLVKNAADIKRFFEGIVELTSRTKPSKARYGAAFQIEGIGLFFLKVCQVNSQKVVFKIAGTESSKNVSQYLCNFFCFLFTI